MSRWHESARLAALTLALAGSGCAANTLETRDSPPDSMATSTPPPVDDEPQKGGVWAECYQRFTPSGDAKADLSRITRSCGPTGGMHAITPVKVAQQQDKDPADRYTFYVPNAGACYRVYATGDRNVKDLDLLLRGPDGQNVVADIGHDSFPVVPPYGPICFDAPGLYMLEVSVFRGGGEYALQVWGNISGLAKSPARPVSHWRSDRQRARKLGRR
jgi:hypothetical protein